MIKPVLAKSKAITIFLVFALGYFISNLLRAITATIAPELVSEFNLTSGELGLLGGAYFLGFASIQIPLGYLLDSNCLLYTSPSPRDGLLSRMPSSA